MNQRGRTARGQPLFFLCLILGGWVLARTMVISSEATESPVTVGAVALASPEASPASTSKPEEAPVEAAGDGGSESVHSLAVPAPIRIAPPVPAVSTSAAPRWNIAPASGGLQPAATPLAPAPVTAPAQPAYGGTGPVPVRVAAGHQLLWMAALSQLPLPGEISAPAAAPAAPKPRPQAISLPRWSADGWLLWRRDGAGPGVGGFAPSTYGASQAGAVVRYRLAPSSEHRPALYLRATSALEAPRGEEAALGLSARPIPGVPVVALAEVRATRFQTGTKLRPAAALVSEFPPLTLPLKARAEAYVQAGYVGGAGATAFVDGQFKIDRPLLRIGQSELRAGGGVWGGAQQGASRLDAGPSATLGLPLGKANARLAMDWRFRVAGNSAPKSGPAITLSAGF